MSHPPRDPFSSVTQILSESRLKPQQLFAELEHFRRNVTVMFTDIKGSTSYFEKHGDIAGMLMVHECNNLLRQCVERHKGRFIKTIGDAIMAIFEKPSDAVRSAIDMQQSILQVNEPKPESDRVTIRIGLHYGTAIVKTSDLFGDAVNVASRVESHAQPEQILISDSVHDEVAATSEFCICHFGRFELKGKAERRDLYAVVWKEGALEDSHLAAHTMVLAPSAGFCLPTFKLQQLRQDGFHVLQLDEDSAGLGLFARRISRSEIIYTTCQLAIMVETGITLSTALGGIVEQEQNPSLRRVLWCGASVGREHGEWSRSRLFLPLRSKTRPATAPK